MTTLQKLQAIHDLFASIKPRHLKTSRAVDGVDTARRWTQDALANEREAAAKKKVARR